MPKGYQLRPDQIAEARRLRAAGNTVLAIAQALGMSTKSVSQYTSSVVMRDAMDAGEETTSARMRILRAVAENGPLAAIDDFPNDVHDIDGHRITHLLYDLAKAGFVTFRENKTGGFLRLVRIAATDRGYRRVGLPARPASAEVGSSLRAPSLHPGDGTDFRNHPSTASGGPITRTHREPAVAAVPAADALPDYPLTRALFSRRAQIEEAARLLEAAGQVDIALSALNAVDAYTPLEREAMAMLERIER